MKSRSGTSAEESPSCLEGYVSKPDLQALRTLVEEIARDFAPRLEQTSVVLYDRDPEHLQVQWYITPQALAEARRLFPGNGTGLRQVLRLCRLDQDGRTNVVASIPQGSGAAEGMDQYDFALRGDGAEYICELGLESDAGGWLLLARSNQVRLGDPHLSAPRIASVPDDTPAQDGAHGTAEELDGPEDIFVEAALVAVGGPLYPAFPNLELDDVPSPGHSASPEDVLDRTRPRDRKPESPPTVPLHSAPYLELGDVLPAGRLALPLETPGQAQPEDRRQEFPSGILQDLAPFPELDGASPGRAEPLVEAPRQGTLGQIESRARGPEYPPGVPSYLVSYRESGDAPPGSPAPPEETPALARPEDWKPEFPPAIPHDPAPYPETGAGFPPGVPIETALAAIGEPLYPAFPNLEPDDSPLGCSAPLESAPLEKALGRVWPQDQSLEFPSGGFQYPAPYPEAATDLSPGAEQVDMPPPLLPSSPGLDAATDAMPGPLYDPRAALSSAVLSAGMGPSVPDMEIHAELIVQGRGTPGSKVDLFGYPIAVGADGRFYIRQSIDISVLQSLAAGRGLLSRLGSVDTHRSGSDCGPFPR